MKKFFYRLALLLCAAVILVSAFQLYRIYSGYAKGEALYENAAQRYTVILPEATQDDAQTTDGSSKPAASDTETGSEVITPPISVDFDTLLTDNPDVVGWLYCPDTPINYPVLQGADNDEYLHHMVDGSYNSAGSLFADYRCAADFSDPNTIIYGHNMKNDSMFGTLHDYSDPDYYDAHPILWLLTPEANYRVDLIAGYIAPADGAIYNAISDWEQLQPCIDQALAQSTFVSQADYEEISRVITLSTCSYEYDEARYILIGIPVLVG